MTHLFFNLSSSLLLFDFNPLLLWKEKLNNFLNQRSSLFARSHETCDPCLFDQENFKQSENKRSKNYKLAKHVLAIRILKTTNNPKSEKHKTSKYRLSDQKMCNFQINLFIQVCWCYWMILVILVYLIYCFLKNPAAMRLFGLIFVKNRSESHKKMQWTP